MTTETFPVLWLCGTSGVGKSSVGWEIHRQLGEEGVTSAYVDLDQIGFLRPPPAEDSTNHRIKAGNLGAIWPGFVAAGARCMVVSGIVEDSEGVETYVDALAGTALTICLLHAGEDVLRERILHRGRGGGPPIPGDGLRGEHHEQLLRVADKAVRAQEDMRLDRLGEHWVDTDEKSVEDVARSVRARAHNWPNAAG